MGLPDSHWGPDVVVNLRELDDTAIIELVCAADRVWGERYGDGRTRVPRCACCHTGRFQSNEYVGVICRHCQHHRDVHTLRSSADWRASVPPPQTPWPPRGGAAQWREG